MPDVLRVQLYGGPADGSVVEVPGPIPPPTLRVPQYRPLTRAELEAADGPTIEPTTFDVLEYRRERADLPDGTVLWRYTLGGAS